MQLSGHLGNGVEKLKGGGIWKERMGAIAPKAKWPKSNRPRPELVFSPQKPFSLPDSTCLLLHLGPQLCPLLDLTFLFYLQSMSSPLWPLTHHLMFRLASAPCQSKMVLNTR